MQPRAGEVAVGLLYDAATQRLVVAGGATGDLTVYDARDGRVLCTANTGPGRFINDVTVTRKAAYLTDSTRRELLVVPLGKRGTLPRTGEYDVLTLERDHVQPEGFGLNGIRDLPNGDLLVVSGGVPYAVDPRNGKANSTTGALVGGDLYVVNGRFRTVGSTDGATVTFTVSKLDLP